ncbi:DUF2975 domain-containing protein [Brevibacterium litoralis]|uniref:DUF2975 domain-containing protein n=1 Tax=Brevibacterium litoralis TaxID=3138935 RepID=UPI0032EBC8A0
MLPDFPRPSLPLVLATYVFLGVLFLVGLGVIVLLPGFSASLAETLPEYADLRDPLLGISTALTLLGLLVLAMVGLLVRRIHRRTILARASLLWVDVLVASFVCAVVLVLAGSVTIVRGQAGSPFLLLLQVLAFVVLVALACVTLVLRSLLRGAIAMRTELDEVV